MELARKHNLRVLEDAAEAFGMRWRFEGKEFKHSGAMGDFGIFSFYPTKTLGGYGDGGMIITNNEELYKLAKAYRVHGAAKKYHHDFVGYNSRLDTMQAAILNVKMKYIEEAIEKRACVAKWYSERLKNCEFVKLPVIKGEQQPVYYVFNIRAEKRDELAEHLSKNEIGYSIYYPRPLHLQNCFDYLGYKQGQFPIAEKACKEVLALPIYPEITEEEVEFVCNTIQNFYKGI